mgnify:CR=1 FL=1
MGVKLGVDVRVTLGGKVAVGVMVRVGVAVLVTVGDGMRLRLTRADATLSLGRLTWPHLLVRVMLAESPGASSS